ncbi:MAG: TetR/AcrR family transcriptional regulator C-terminal domain-containing protein [Gluconacetobacter diazotrophicus]|nr:TetR/AcrR family transcriptional regulator C-terminal domain-containing protein [Gluconacetobacter diazotrophicus]
MGTVRRPRGRPVLRSDEETRHVLGTAAAAEFTRHGYANTSVAAVAKAAGVSTRTLYRLVPTKAELFELSMGDRIDAFLLAVDERTLEALDTDAALEHILIAFGALLMDPGCIAISRVLYAEAERFPEIATRFSTVVVSRVDAAIARWLRDQESAGRIRLPEGGGSASGFLRGMMIGDVHRAVLLRQAEPPDAATIAARARTCARLFLDGCRA